MSRHVYTYDGPDGRGAVVVIDGSGDWSIGASDRDTFLGASGRMGWLEPRWKTRAELCRLARDWCAHGIGWCQHQGGPGVPRRGVGLVVDAEVAVRMAAERREVRRVG